jgi:transposase
VRDGREIDRLGVGLRGMLLRMRDKDLYATILGIRSPWHVSGVDVEPGREEVRVTIEANSSARFACPTCDKAAPRYDSRRRSWRHLDTCQFKTLLEADVPRVRCPDHGVVQVHVPWAEPGSGFTALMEALIIDWLKEASIQAVARRLRLTWDQIDGVMQRAVARGLKRRTLSPMARLCVDETSFQKRHEYVTFVTDMKTGNVVHVADGRNKAVLDDFWRSLSKEQLAAVEVVAMDMCQAYISSTLAHVEGAEKKIAFDRFHVARAINDAVNSVRKQEHRELCARDYPILQRTRSVWITNPENHDERQDSLFRFLKDLGLKVARAFAMKEAARGLWGYTTRGWAERGWLKWIGWAMRSRLEPMKRVARMVRDHLWGILNAVVLNATNALSESVAAKVQRIKNMACGFRNRERFRNAIYFHCGGLDLYPVPLRATHTTS